MIANLQAFISDNAQRIYQIQPPKKLVTLTKQAFSVPAKYGDATSMLAGKELEWSINKVKC